MTNGTEVLQTWFRRVWKEEDSTAIEEMFPPVGEARGLGGQTLVGPEDFKQFQRALCALLSDIDISIDMSLEHGVWTAALCTLHAISRATGIRVTMTGTVFVRVEDGKIMEGYNHFDFMGLWGQLGYLPSDSFEQGLSGQKIDWQLDPGDKTI